MAYLGRREYVFVQNVSSGSWVKMLRVLVVRLQMALVILIRSLSISGMFGIENGVV